MEKCIGENQTIIRDGSLLKFGADPGKEKCVSIWYADESKEHPTCYGLRLQACSKRDQHQEWQLSGQSWVNPASSMLFTVVHEHGKHIVYACHEGKPSSVKFEVNKKSSGNQGNQERLQPMNAAFQLKKGI